MKDYSVQSAFKFIMRDHPRPTDDNEYYYALNLYDPNENVEWKDVQQVIFNMINATDVQCPICMEPLSKMLTPRITKCGHIYCWPCVLQYLAYDKDPTRSWKRCPLCNDPIYKNEMKAVHIHQSHYYKVGEKITFHLMVRSKGNVIVRDKAAGGIDGGTLMGLSPDISTAKNAPVKLYTNKFP